MSQTFVVIGAGLAGAKAVESLRGEGHDGRLVLVGAESELPYERPPLSKDYLRGESPREKTHALPDDFYATNDVELRLETTVAAIHADQREIVLGASAYPLEALAAERTEEDLVLSHETLVSCRPPNAAARESRNPPVASSGTQMERNTSSSRIRERPTTIAR